MDVALTGDDGVAGWVEDLEYGRLALPRPELTMHVTAPGGLQEQRIASRADADARLPSRSIPRA